MKRILTLLIVISGLPLFSQNLELNGGMNHNAFFNLHRNDTPYNQSYSPGNGYQIGIGINDLRLDTVFNFRFTLNYINYGGGFDRTSGGMGGATTIKGTVNKSVLSFGIYPLNAKFFKRIDFNLGLELSCLLSEKTHGTVNWADNSGTGSARINEKYNNFSSKTYVGIAARIAYPIRITERLSISPQIGCYFGGLSREFNPDVVAGARSFRQYYSIGIQRTLK